MSFGSFSFGYLGGSSGALTPAAPYIAASLLTIPSGLTGIAGHLLTNLPGTIIWSKDSGSPKVTVEPDGDYSLSGILEDGEDAIFVARATNDENNEFLTGVITLTGQQVLLAISLSAETVIEDSPIGTTVGSLLGLTPGSAVTLIDDAGERFALDNGDIETGPTATDYEVATSHVITVREIKGDYVRSTDLTVTVINTDDLPLLSDVTLSDSVIQETSPPGTEVGELVGFDPEATIELVDDANGRFALSFDPVPRVVTGLVRTDHALASSHIVTVRQTKAGAANSPKDTDLTISVQDKVEVAAFLLPMFFDDF